MTPSRTPPPLIPPARVVFPPEARQRILSLIDGVLTSGDLTLGPLTAKFETTFAARHGHLLPVATNSGTSALEIALRVIGVAGREVIVPANTFYATAAAVVHAGPDPRGRRPGDGAHHGPGRAGPGHEQ